MTQGPGVIDRGLRRRLVTPDSLQQAVDALAHTPGNRERRRLVKSSLQRPWSAGEREFHALLRRARITGWVGNHQAVALGDCYILDVVFVAERLAIEIDDYATHRHADAFVDDRVRHNQLTAAGWRVLHLTEGMVVRQPERTLDWVRRALRTP